MLDLIFDIVMLLEKISVEFVYNSLIVIVSGVIISLCWLVVKFEIDKVKNLGVIGWLSQRLMMDKKCICWL
jgi:hypothetical protein